MLTLVLPALGGGHLHMEAVPGAATPAVALLPGAMVGQYAPAAQAERLGRLAVGVGFHLAVAVFGGWVLARLMHYWRVHWSWAVVVGAAAIGAHAVGLDQLLAWMHIVGGLGWHTVVLAAIITAARAERLQRAQEWQQPGLMSDDCTRTPLAAVGALATRAYPQLVRAVRRARGALARVVGSGHVTVTEASEVGRALAASHVLGRFAAALWQHSRGGARPDGALLLGRTKRGRSVHVPAQHTVVVGASGAGKTVTMRRVLSVTSGRMGVVAVDGKGDVELERDLERFARDAGRRFLAWSPDRSTRYSPFAHGSDTEIVDKALAAESWGDDYYLRLGQRFLGFAVRALRAAGRPPTLSALARYVDPEMLEELAPEMETAQPGSFNELIAAMPALDRGERQAIAGTQHRLAAMAESDVGPLLEPAPGHPTIDLLAAVTAGDVVYFNLHADSRPALSRMVGAAVIRDLVSISATMIGRCEHMPTALVFDDIQAFATEATLAGIASLFARGRQPGMLLLLGTQSLADLGGSQGAGVMEQLMDSRATLIVHRLPGYRSATRASQELGDHEGQAVSEQLDGSYGRWRPRGSATRSAIQVPNVRARELMDLPTGVAAVKSTGLAPCLVHVLPPD